VRPRRRGKDIGLKEILCKDVDWIHLAQDAAQLRPLLNTVTNFRVP